MNNDLIERLRDEADLCRNDGASDIAALLDEAADALEQAQPPAPQGVESDIDITDKVEFGAIDGTLMPLEKCACGRKFDSWDFILREKSNSFGDHKQCPSCGRYMYFVANVRVFEAKGPQ